MMKTIARLSFMMRLLVEPLPYLLVPPNQKRYGRDDVLETA